MTEKEKNKEEEDEDEDEKEEVKCSRSIQVQSLNTCVEITSENNSDTLNKMKKLAEYFLDKYK